MSAADYQRWYNGRGRASWKRYERADADIPFFEDLLKDWRWCAYTRDFEHISKFSADQRVADISKRFCFNYSTPAIRASMSPSVVMTDEVLRVHAEKARIIVVGINDTVVVAAPTARELRAAARTDQDVEEMVEDIAGMHAQGGHADEGDADGGADEVEAEDGPAREANISRGKRAIARQENVKRRRDKKAATMTAEQLQQRARDRAELEARLTKEALDEYIIKKLPNLIN